MEGLLKGQYWAESVETMKQFVARHPGEATDVRIQLAYVLLTKTNQPSEAEIVVSSLHANLLPPSEREKVIKLKAAIAARVS
jgi:hypothetical protein